MKTKRRSITFFSFFPAVALLATPLMFSTLAPAETGDFAVDSSDWIVPQSFMTTDEILEAANVNNKDIGEVRFLDYGDSIYGGGENASSLISSSPAILDSGEVETAYVLQNPEFQRQVEELSAQAAQAGSAMPPLLTLVALFAFAVATGTSSLKEFFKFSTYTEKVKKTIQVTKKVAKTVYKTITETVARKVKTVKQVAYTAYETVKNVVYNTRTWVTEVVRHKSVTWHPLEQMEMKAKFLLDNINKYQGKFTRSYAKNVRYYTPNLSEYAYLKKEYDDVASGRKVGRYAQNVQHRVWNERQTLDSQAGQFFDGIADPKLREKLLSEYKSLNDVTYTEKTTHSETTPVVTYVEKPYTAYRDEVETKTVYDTVTREVPETIYEDVIENHEVVEDVTKYAFTPINEKIDLAMNYLKNYQKILQSPSNRNFLDSALSPNRDTLLLAGAYEAYNQLTTELQTASIYNMDRTDPKEVEKLLKRHNEFVYSMKSKLAEIEQGKTPEEQIGILFGKTYTDSIRESENAIAQTEAEEKAISARFEEIGEMERTNKISTGYARSLYNTAKKNRDQLYRRKRDAIKNLKEGKEYYSRRFNGTISSLKNLSFLRSLEDWRNALASGERSVAASRLVPFTTASGSVIYRKPAQATTTVAQPKKTIPQPANLTTANAANSKYLETLRKIANAKTTEAEPQNGRVISEKVLGSSNPLARWWRNTKGGYTDSKAYFKNLESELEVDYMTGKKTKRQKFAEGLMLDISSFVLPTVNALGNAAEPLVEKSIDVMDYITNNPNWSLQNYLGEKVYDTGWYKDFYKWWISGVEPTYEQLQNSWNNLPADEKRTFQTAALFYATVLTFYGAARVTKGGLTRISKPLSVYSDSAVLNALKSSINVSQKAKSGFEQGLGRVAALTEGKTVIPDLKTDTPEGMLRAKQKIADDYMGDVSKLTDILRGSIVYDDMGALQNGLKTLSKNAKILEIEDRFANPLRSGYRDIKVLVEEPNGAVAEVQLHIKEMFEAKIVETPTYNEFRKLEKLLSSTTDATEILKISSRMEYLNAKSKKIFDKAWEEFLKRTNQ